MAKLLDCDPIASLETIDNSLVIEVTVEATELEKPVAGVRIPALKAYWAPIGPANIVGVEFEVVCLSSPAQINISYANKSDQGWVKTDGLIPGEDYEVRFRARGAAARTFGPWSSIIELSLAPTWLATMGVGAMVKVGAEALLKVQGQSFTVMAGDGETVPYGHVFDVPPVVVAVGLDNLLLGDIGPGDFLQTSPVAVNTDTFTGRARRRNNGAGGTLTDRVDEGTGDATSGPAQIIYRQKETAGVAYNNTYTATFIARTASRRIGLPPDGEIVERQMTVGFFGRKVSAGSWTQLGSTIVTSDPSTTSAMDTTCNIVGTVEWDDWPEISGSGTDGYEYKLEVTLGYLTTMTIVEFSSVTWKQNVGATDPINVSALAAGQKLIYLVIPQAGDSGL